MPVLKEILFSLRKLFRRRKQRRKAKRKVGRKALPRARRKPVGRSRAARHPKKKIKKKQNVPSVKRSPRAQAPAAVSASRGKSPSGKTQPPGQPVGEITHYFSKIQVAVVKMTKGNLAVGDKVRVSSPQDPSGQRLPAGRRKSTDFIQTVRSMQIESVEVRCARRGQLIGLKIERGAKVGDKLYKLYKPV